MNVIYGSWKTSLKSKQRKHTYKHLDAPLDLDNRKDYKRVINVLEKLNTHQFLPFIKFVKKDICYQRNEHKKPERTKKERPIMYASHIDAYVYSFYAHQWAKKYEEFILQEKIEENVTAYRKVPREDNAEHGKNNIYFARDVFEHIQATGTCSVIIADISKFFDTLNHKKLKENISMVLGKRLSKDEYKIFKSLTSFRYILNDSRQKKGESSYIEFMLQVRRELKKGNCSLAQIIYEKGGDGIIQKNKTTVGIPQGSPLSGLLANIYMAKFDSGFVKKFPNILYRRYSDDIVIVYPGLETENIISSLYTAINKTALKINLAKIFIATFKKTKDGTVLCNEVKKGDGEVLNRKTIDYLGFEFDGQTTRIRNKTLQKAYRKAKKKSQEFSERQTDRNPRKQHGIRKGSRKKGSDAYIKNAGQVMKNNKQGIKSQQEKLSEFIRKNKKL